MLISISEALRSRIGYLKKGNSIRIGDTKHIIMSHFRRLCPEGAKGKMPLTFEHVKSTYPLSF